MEKVNVASLLTEADWETIRAHMAHMQDLHMEREQGTVSVTITITPNTAKESKAWGGTAMLIRAVSRFGGRRDMQYFASVERCRKGLEGWTYERGNKLGQIPAATEEAPGSHTTPDPVRAVRAAPESSQPIRERRDEAEPGCPGGLGGALWRIRRLLTGAL